MSSNKLLSYYFEFKLIRKINNICVFIVIILMGCETSRQKKLAKLQKISNYSLDERQIENILIHTYCKFKINKTFS